MKSARHHKKLPKIIGGITMRNYANFTKQQLVDIAKQQELTVRHLEDSLQELENEMQELKTNIGNCFRNQVLSDYNRGRL